MKEKVNIKPQKVILLNDIADLIVPESRSDSLPEIPIYALRSQGEQTIVIDSFHVIKQLNHVFPGYEYELIGGKETIVEINAPPKKYAFLLISFVWILLFVGTAMTIINFHYDVSMLEVQQRIHYLLTGKVSKYPLFIQIPYSLGLGAGMVIFLNYWFKKKLNDEPSPLEVELFNYERNLDEYKIYHENELDDKKPLT